MGLFSKQPETTEGAEYRGGCAEHDMRGPKRGSLKAANKDATDHGKRMHGSTDYPGGYVERVK